MNKIKKHITSHIEKTNIGNRIVHNIRYRIIFIAFLGLLINIAYAVYNGILGIIYSSLWFITMFVYYTILSVMRFSTVLCERKSNSDTEGFVMRFTGVMLIIMSFVLAGSVYYSIIRDVAQKNGTITMITIATYTFYKFVMAIINVVKVRKHKSLLLTTIRNISCADALVSIFSLQRSMLVSFEGMSAENIKVMNICTGAGVCFAVFVLGLLMTFGIVEKRNNKI